MFVALWVIDEDIHKKPLHTVFVALPCKKTIHKSLCIFWNICNLTKWCTLYIKMKEKWGVTDQTKHEKTKTILEVYY